MSDKEQKNFLSKFYPLVFREDEKPEWNSPGVDSLDRFLREWTRSAETRDIVRALIRHRDEIGGNVTTAADDQIEDWTGIDAANVGRRVRQDRIFKGLIQVRRGKPRRAGEKSLASEYIFSTLFPRWRAFIEAEQRPPSEDLVEMEFQDWASKKNVMIGQFRAEAIKQAFIDVAARMNRPLVKRDRRKVVERAIELAKDRLAEQAARRSASAPGMDWSPQPGAYRAA